MSWVANSYSPASTQLLGALTRAKFGKMAHSIRQPRKRWLAVLSLILAFIWLSQAISSVFLREAANPDKLAIWLPLGLACYTAYHIIKLATRPLEEPFQWTEAERELILAAPLTRNQQITFRMQSIGMAALAKAACFAILMIPDLNYVWLGFIGMLPALLLIDLIRVLAELLFHGLNPRIRNYFRAAVITMMVAGAGTLVWLTLTLTDAHASTPAALQLVKQMFALVVSAAESPIGMFLLAPFRLFTDPILASELSWSIGSKLVLGSALAGGLLVAVYWVDAWSTRQIQGREKASLTACRESGATAGYNLKSSRRSVFVPPRLNGVGPIAWRQLLGVANYRATILFSLAVPVFLSCIPMLAEHDPTTMLLHLVGGAVFYSFLLLPAALMLDYRRDINRMTVLKALPISPLAVTIGQLLTPVLVCWGFQAAVLMIGLSLGRVNGLHAVFAWALLLPVNVLIFAIENYIFLLSPFQRNKEGFDVLIRTILTFTGKGLLFAVGLVAIMVWAWVAIAATQWFELSKFYAALLFGTGVWVIGAIAATAFVLAIARQFERFDPSQDVPGQG